MPSFLQKDEQFVPDVKYRTDESQDIVARFSIKKPWPKLNSARIADAYVDAALHILDKASTFHTKYLNKDENEANLNLHLATAQASMHLMRKVSSDYHDVKDAEDDIVILN